MQWALRRLLLVLLWLSWPGWLRAQAPSVSAVVNGASFQPVPLAAGNVGFCAGQQPGSFHYLRVLDSPAYDSGRLDGAC